MIRLIISDLDGTALDDNKKLDSGLFEIIPTLKEKGILFNKHVYLLFYYVLVSLK